MRGPGKTTLNDIRADSAVKALGLVLRDITARKGEPAGRGTVACPACGRTIAFAFVRGKGPSRRSLSYDAKCETSGCITFMGH